MRIVYVCTVYNARINRRVRPVGDGLVAAMAHLWSKFTKCLRPSKGASDPGALPECCPSECTMPRHSPLLCRCYHHLAETTRFLFSSTVHSSPRSSTSSLFVPRSNLYDLPKQSKALLPLIMNVTLITKYFSSRSSIFQQCDVVFYLLESLGKARSAKVAERINCRSLPNKVCSRLQLDFIYGFYSECI